MSSASQTPQRILAQQAKIEKTEETEIAPDRNARLSGERVLSSASIMSVAAR